MKKLIFTLLCLLCTMGAWAESYTDANDVTWTYSYNSSSQSITLTAASGLGENVVCPDVITHNEVEYPVTSMSDIFDSNKTIKTVVLPKGLTSIGSTAFYNCSSLTSINIPESVISIGSSTFSGCSSLTSINIPGSMTSIGGSAFSGCSSLDEVHISDIAAWCNLSLGDSHSNPLNYATKLFVNDVLVTDLVIPNGVTSIRSRAFTNCENLTSINIPGSVTSIGYSAFYGCSSLTSINIPGSVTSIEEYAFSGCSSLTSINIPGSVTSIEEYAFYGCSSLTSINIPKSVTSIEEYAFSGATNCIVKMEATTPPIVSNDSFSEAAVFMLPNQKAYESYCADENWKEYITQLTYEEAATKAVTLTANEQVVSALYTAIGEDNLKFVYDLTIEGTINGSDIYIMRNKMTALRKLDLSQARIVSGGVEYYQGHTTQNDVLGARAFYDLDLWQVELPEQLTSIDQYAFSDCNYLQRIEIPEGVTSIGQYSFYSCHKLKDVTFPKTLKVINSSAFSICKNLTKIILPIGLETIGSHAFWNCSSLKEIRFPSGLKKLGGDAFSSCNAITDVYSYTIEPIEMEEETFSETTVKTATLHYPTTSWYNYYTNGGWGEFLNAEVFDEPYEYFYLNNDYTLNEGNGGVIDGTPDVDINEGGGLIVEDTNNETQKTDDMNIHHNGGHGGNGVGGSIIADDNLHANKVHFRITVKGGQWHFFSFPFNIKKENIKCEGGADWIFHFYDGEERAANGKGGWKKVTSEEGQGNFLKAGVGYIFQSSKDDVLVITVDEDDNANEAGIRINKEDKSNDLEVHKSENEQDASWNFTGNPHLSYYDLDVETYNAPITVWDGSKYVAVRPGDDDYQLAPFQAFFVQKPEGMDEINFWSKNQMTHQQKEAKEAAALAYGRTTTINANRLIVNVSLTDGNESDKTRVVFNNAHTMDYERSCDAAKFASAGVPQLYTLDSRKVRYAINERPQDEGTVPMGYSAPTRGIYTIDAPRMDTPMMLKDLQTGAIHDLSEGGYEFMSEAGTFENRFVLVMRAVVTGIGKVTLGNIEVTATKGAIEVNQLNGETLNVYTTGGEQVATSQTDGAIPVAAGIYVVEANGKSVKVAVK